MPFQVFRRHQKKMMAGLAIFAMIAFTLDFSLFRNQFGAAAQDRVVVELYGKRVRQSDILGMLNQRLRANDFMMQVSGRPDYFGRLDTRSIVDALILQHEAERLGMPIDKALAVKWLRDRTDNQLTTALFDRIYHQRFADKVTDAQLLEDIANQIRLSEVAALPGFPPITPLDVFEAYRDQNERVSAHAVPFRVEDYVKDVPDP
jgi:peptidyl-prolyl cis-trans isomerase D